MFNPIVLTESYSAAAYNVTLLLGKINALINEYPQEIIPVNRTEQTISGEPAHTLGDIIFATEAAKYHSSYMNHGWAGWGECLAQKYGADNVDMVNQLGWSDLLQGSRRFTPIDSQLKFRFQPYKTVVVDKVESLLNEAYRIVREYKLDIGGSSVCHSLYTLCEYWYGKDKVPQPYQSLAWYLQG